MAAVTVLHHLRTFSYSAMNTFIQTSHALLTSIVYRTNINESSIPQKEQCYLGSITPTSECSEKLLS